MSELRTDQGGAAAATRSVLGRGSIYTLATAAPAGAGVVVLPLVTRLLPPPEYAVVAIALIVVQVGLVALGLGLGAAVTRNYILDAGGRGRALGLVWHGSWLAVALGVLLIATGPLWGRAALGVPWSATLTWAGVAAAAGSIVVLCQSFLRGDDRAPAFVALATAAHLGGPLVGLALLVAAGRPEPVHYAIGLAAGQVAAALAGLLLVARYGRPDLSRRGLSRGMSIGLPTLPHQVALYVAVGGLIVVAQHRLGAVAGGQAGVVLTLGVGATAVIAGLNNAWAPAVYRAAPAERPALLTHSTHLIGLLAAAFAGSIALVGPWLLVIAASARYDRAELVVPLALTTAAAVPAVVYLASAHLVFAAARTWGLVVTTPVSVLAGTVVAAVAAGPWGLVGIGAGYPVTYVVLATLTTFLQRRVSDTPWWPPAMPDVLLLTAAATAAGALLPSAGTGAVLRGAALLLLLAVTAVLALRAGRTRAS